MMQVNKTYPQIEDLKNQIINLALILGTSVGFIVYLLSLNRYFESGFEITFFTDLLVVLILFVITIFRKKLSIQIKSYISIGAIYSLFLVNCIVLGIFSADNILIILIPFTSLLALSHRKTIGIFVFTIISFFILAYLHLYGILKAPSQEHIMLSSWLINILIIAIVATVIVIIQTKFNSTYDKLIVNLEKKNTQLSEKERNYREIFNASTDAIFIHDLKGKILDVNESMLKMYGYEPEDIANITIEELSSEKESFTTNLAIEFVKKAINGEPQLFDWQAKTKEGEYFWVEVSLKKTNIGANERVLAVVRDITNKKEDTIQLELYRNHLKDLVAHKTNELEKTNEELKATNDDLAQQKEELLSTLNELKSTQQKLIQSEKMASLGVLSAGIAHEINNPLNFIQGGLYGLENYFEENLSDHVKEIKPLMLGIAEGIKRATAIITSLNHYSRSGSSKTELFDIHSIIDNCLVILHNQLKNKTEVIKKFTEAYFNLIGNEGQLHQLILNILTNSIQAISEKGVITIETKLNKDKLTILIQDNGSGISMKNIDRIFDPFFTTKEAGQGTGLGLSISLRIIQDHEGTIEYQSTENEGTIVTISLPAINCNISN